MQWGSVSEFVAMGGYGLYVWTSFGGEVIQRVRDACVEGSQAYWVCPLIEESEALQLQTAFDTYQRVAATFPELKVGLVHGRLAGSEKAAVMQSFQSGAILSGRAVHVPERTPGQVLRHRRRHGRRVSQGGPHHRPARRHPESS